MGPDSLHADNPIALMARETAAREADVPQVLDGSPFPVDGWRFGPDWFAFGVPGLRYFYRRGHGIDWQCLDESWRMYVPLYLSGSVYSAVASLNGLFPLHVSAVLHEGRVHAIGGPSGAGKSTLACALAGEGLPLVADDTLLLVLDGAGPPFCLPGHKRLKLARDAFELAPAERQEVADDTRDKFYAEPPLLAPDGLFPLASIIFLEEGPELRLDRLGGGERLARLGDDHYTTYLFDQARQVTPEQRFALQLRIAREIDMAILRRPLDRESFPNAVALATQYVRTGRT